MRNRHLKPSLFVVIALLAFSSPATSQEPSAAGMVPVHMVITAEARHGAQEPDLNREDVTVYLGRTRTQVADWAPLRGEHAGLELFLLLDDSSDVSLGSQLEDLRQFILLQPPTTLIGIGYMRDGGVDTVQNFTADHLQAAKALRLPLGTFGAFASPYLSLSDLLKRWPESPLRHEVLMITDGIDRFGGVGPANPYVDTAIEQAQKAGVLVHSIFASGVGHFGRMQWPVYWGQNYLSEIATETGGQAYFLGYETPVSFAPYLQDLSRRLNHQYLLTFLAKPEKKPGLQRVRVRTEVPNVELVAATKVFVPAGS
jgi:hypothetical protein